MPCPSAARRNGARRTSATAARTWRTSRGRTESTSAATGRAMCNSRSRVFPRKERFSKFSDTMPPVGRRPIFTAMTKRPSARTKSGITRRAAVPHESRRSGKRPRWSPLQMPSGRAIPHASSMTVTVMLLAWGIALPLGIWSADHLGRLPDRLLSWGTAALLVIPDLVLALGLLVIAVKMGRLPTGGMVSLNFENLSFLGKTRDLLLHMALPVAALVLSVLPLLVRHVRAAVAEVLLAPFLLAAEGHGIPRRTLLYRYALPAAANPLVALFGFSIGSLLSGSLLIEVVMSWPGLGPFLLEAILARDIYVVIGGVLLSTLFLVGGNFLADLLLYWADPRIRTETGP